METKIFMSIDHAAQRVGVSKRQFSRMIDEGKLGEVKMVRFGGGRPRDFVMVESFDKWLYSYRPTKEQDDAKG